MDGVMINDTSSPTSGYYPENNSTSRDDFSRAGYTNVAIILGVIGLFGFLNNLLVIMAWVKNKSLRTPVNMFLINLCIGDFTVSVFGTPFAFAANVAGKWLYGEVGCSWYAFINTAAGTSAIITLTAISLERYYVVVHPLQAHKIQTVRFSTLGVILIWLVTLCIALPPVFGWGHYGPEGPGTCCSVNWESEEIVDVTYIIFIFTTVLLIPLTVIIYCYVSICYAVYKSHRMFTSHSNNRVRLEMKIVAMTVLLVACFLICWSPYAILSLYVAFGNADKITPTVAFVPSIFAKTSTMYNPVIYFAMNKQFREALCKMICYRRVTIDIMEDDLTRCSSHRASSVNSPAVIAPPTFLLNDSEVMGDFCAVAPKPMTPPMFRKLSQGYPNTLNPEQLETWN
ncbi:visual pigment-like receptor peropsin [Ptychodera flava]|uniref:visual pigment-like receptor peropsin n=1 Tax=Ptychodera flava TaxID=63121 RepID=UPI003969CE0F